MIPKIIHQTIPDKKNINPAFLDNIEKLKQRNPGWEHRLYDDIDLCGIIDPKIYNKINPAYGVIKADLFRYYIMHDVGGIYLDIKSTAIKPLDTILLDTDEYLLSHWKYKDWGKHPELKPEGEYQQWYIIARPQHPYLAAILKKVKERINDYTPEKYGVGKIGVLRVSGPIPYTLAIYETQGNHRIIDTDELGLKYAILDHRKCFKNHYSTLTEPLIL